MNEAGHDGDDTPPEDLSPTFLRPDPESPAVRRVLGVGLVAGMALSFRLWVPDRWFPTSPVASWLPAVSTPVGYVWLGVLLASLAVVVVSRRPRPWILASLVLIGLLGLWDQNRWQPWAYQYFFLLLALSFVPGRALDPRQAAGALHVCRLIVAATYVWSGTQKLNASFLDEVHPWLIQPVLEFLPGAARPVLELAGIGVPFLEAAIGLGLLFRPCRGVAVVLAVGMHATLLLLLGPWGHDWNSVIWPWNVVMSLLVIALFWRTPGVTTRDIVWPRRLGVHLVVVVAFGVMPLFSFLGLWDQYLSAALYSGNTSRAGVYLSPAAYEELPAPIRREARQIPADARLRYYLSLDAVSVAELNVPLYPALRVYRDVASELRDAAEEPQDVVLVVTSRPHWLTGHRTTMVPGGQG